MFDTALFWIIKSCQDENTTEKFKAQVNFSGPWENVYALWQHLSSVVMKYYCTVLFRVFGDSKSD